MVCLTERPRDALSHHKPSLFELCPIAVNLFGQPCSWRGLLSFHYPGTSTHVLNAAKHQEGPKGGEILQTPGGQVSGVGRGFSGKTSQGRVRVGNHSACCFFRPEMSPWASSSDNSFQTY